MGMPDYIKGEEKMKRDKKIAGILAMAILIVTFSGNIQAQVKVEDIDTFIKKFEVNEHFNGVVLVAQNGTALFKKAYGFANREWEIPNTVDTRFRIGSITKQFTSFLIMQLVEQGRIELSRKLSDYLPYYRKDNGNKISVHHLLTHTSGLPLFSKNPLPEDHVGPFPVKEFVEKYCSDDLNFEPGSSFLYSNCGYYILGAIIESVTGKTYEEALTKMILEPAGMRNTGYDHPEKILLKRAYGYGVDNGVLFNARYQNMSIPFAAGALYSTVDDFLLWDKVLYSGELLSKKSTNTMLSPHVAGENYGYGWYVSKDTSPDASRPITVCSHGGGITQFNSLIVRRIEERILIVIFSNVYGTRLGAMSKGLNNILHNKPADVI
jgi:CubicO group peptidase (beta-lactamase class C family)